MTSRPAAPGAGTGFTAKLINAVTGVSSMEQADREVPEPETPEVDAAIEAWEVWVSETPSLRGDEPPHGWDLARSLERRLSLAQTEIKGHMRVVDGLKVDAARYRFIRNLIAVEDVDRLIAEGNPTPDEQESLSTDATIDAALKSRA